MKLKKFDLIEIDWDDSVENTSGWNDFDNFDFDNHYQHLSQKTVGYFLKETKNAISTSKCRGLIEKYGGQFNGVWTIPKGCIKKIKKLKRRQ